ncbi:hypothetical protein QUC31_005853 [Theobroma cacao]|nr:Poly(A) binding 8-like protein [Theobroma cacao]WRX12366.1 Polyadenylate-binding protein/Hyperplastic disc protein - like 1 [Theobroma cacao]
MARRGGSISTMALGLALATATPDQVRTVLGERLHPLVQNLEPAAAARVTGMLLELDRTEVLHLLESPEALKSRVAEAMEVLISAACTPLGTAVGTGKARRGGSTSRRPISMRTLLRSALANATPDQERTILGERLYPLVEKLEPAAAAKVTGMLLELGRTEILHLLESPVALTSMVAQAIGVLRNSAQQRQDQTGGAKSRSIGHHCH